MLKCLGFFSTRLQSSCRTAQRLRGRTSGAASASRWLHTLRRLVNHICVSSPGFFRMSRWAAQPNKFNCELPLSVYVCQALRWFFPQKCFRLEVGLLSVSAGRCTCVSETPSVIVSLSALTAALVLMRLLLLCAAVRPPVYFFTLAQVSNRWNRPYCGKQTVFANVTVSWMDRVVAFVRYLCVTCRWVCLSFLSLIIVFSRTHALCIFTYCDPVNLYCRISRARVGRLEFSNCYLGFVSRWKLKTCN